MRQYRHTLNGDIYVAQNSSLSSCPGNILVKKGTAPIDGYVVPMWYMRLHPLEWEEIVEQKIINDCKIVLWYDGKNKYQHSLRQVTDSWMPFKLKRDFDCVEFKLGDQWKEQDGKIYTITVIREGFSNPQYYFDGVTSSGDTYIGKPSWEAEKYVVSKKKKPEFTILSFRNNFGKRIYNLKPTGQYDTNDRLGIGARDLKFCIAHYEIHSVRRESDGKIFTIGDNFSNSTADQYSTHKIEQFAIINNQIRVYFDKRSYAYYPLYSINKL